MGRVMARCLVGTFPQPPPFRTGLATLTASGSAPEVLLHARHGASVSILVASTDVRLCLIPFHQPTLNEGTACAFAGYFVRHLPLYSILPRLGAFAISPHPGVDGFPVLRLLCPIRLLMKSLEFRWALACLLPTLLSILHEVSRVPTVGLKQDDLGSVFLGAPSALCGSSVIM